MRRQISQQIALGGVFAALALVIMSVIGLIPIATFTSPMLCIVLESIVLRNCGRRIGWAWYGAVAFLSLFMAPDKEAAIVFCFLGNYPMLKVRFDKSKLKLGLLYKLIYFNGIVIFVYILLLRLLGLGQLLDEYSQLGMLLGLALIGLGNLAFMLMDIILNRVLYKK